MGIALSDQHVFLLLWFTGFGWHKICLRQEDFSEICDDGNLAGHFLHKHNVSETFLAEILDTIRPTAYKSDLLFPYLPSTWYRHAGMGCEFWFLLGRIWALCVCGHCPDHGACGPGHRAYGSDHGPTGSWTMKFATATFLFELLIFDSDWYVSFQDICIASKSKPHEFSKIYTPIDIQPKKYIL